MLWSQSPVRTRIHLNSGTPGQGATTAPRVQGTRGQAGHVPRAQSPAMTWAWGKSDRSHRCCGPGCKDDSGHRGFNVLYVQQQYPQPAHLCLTSPGTPPTQLQFSPGQTQRQL